MCGRTAVGTGTSSCHTALATQPQAGPEKHEVQREFGAHAGLESAAETAALDIQPAGPGDDDDGDKHDEASIEQQQAAASQKSADDAETGEYFQPRQPEREPC